MTLFRRVLRYLRPYRGRFALSLVLVAVGAALEAARPWPLKVVIDYVLGEAALPALLAGWSRPALLVAACAGLLALQLGAAGLALVLNRISIAIGQRMVHDLRAELVAHLHGLSLGFFGRRPGSDLVYRVVFDSFAVQSMLMNGLFPLASAAALLLAMTAAVVSIQPLLAAIFLALAPVLFVLIGAFGRRIEKLSTTLREQESHLMSEAQRGVGAIHVVQAFTAEAFEQERVMRASTSALDSALRLYLFQTGYSGAVNVLIALGTAAVLYAGGSLGLAGRLSAGDLVVFISYLAALYAPINSISQTAGLMRGAAAGARRVFEILDAEPEVRDRPDARPLRGVRGDVRFEGVSFRYPGGDWALREVSFEARAGMRVALVGRTGAGKTTLASLIPRFHDPSEGFVTLDGVDLRALRLRELRAQIGIVPQAPVLFPASIGDNIRYGAPHASEAAVRRAAELAGVAAFVEKLPQGYATVLGPQGQALSQGQMQRVTIARALLRDPRLLILDEPTSALDSETETFVMRGIEQAMAGRTSFVIAHRLSTVRRADLVLVLEDGRLVESGTFDALRRAGGAFQRLYDAQALRGSEPAPAPSPAPPGASR
jgi:ATP-binding cassette subfamily B protein/subfamily B ATP-binding cassette protein MsbA